MAATCCAARIRRRRIQVTVYIAIIGIGIDSHGSVFAVVVTPSSLAIGGSLSGLTVIVTVAESHTERTSQIS